MAKSPESRHLGWFPFKVPGAVGRQARDKGGVDQSLGSG